MPAEIGEGVSMATEAKTRAEFETALANADQLILLVMGDGADFDEIAQNADNAIAFDETQAAVWLRDATVLTSKEQGEFRPGDPTYVACALSRPPRRVCALVARPLALTMYFMQALKAAQEERQPPKVFE